MLPLWEKVKIAEKNYYIHQLHDPDSTAGLARFLGVPAGKLINMKSQHEVAHWLNSDC